MSIIRSIKPPFQLAELDKKIIKDANDNLTMPFFNRLHRDPMV